MPETTETGYTTTFDLSTKLVVKTTLTVLATTLVCGVASELVKPQLRKAINVLKTENAKWTHK
jgi:hypothetical protein